MGTDHLAEILHRLGKSRQDRSNLDLDRSFIVIIHRSSTFRLEPG